MGWFGGRSDSVETVEGAQEVVSRVSSDLAKKKDLDLSKLQKLKNDELLPIQEDIQMAETCTYRIKAATVKPQERLMLYTLGEHVFEVGADSSEQGPEA